MNKNNATPQYQVMDDFVDDPLFTPSKIKRGKVVEGTVISMSNNQILIDLGAKSEGVIFGKEMRQEKEFLSTVKEGDTILASVTQVENDHGQIVLSLKKAGIERRWRMLESAYKDRTSVKVKVVDHNRGGLLVDCGIRGFIPISQLSQDLFPNFGNQEVVQDSLQQLKGTEIKAYVLEANRKQNKLILSARPLDQISFSVSHKADILAKVKIDDIIEGAITRIVPFGILVDVGGFDGLVHISEVSWDRLKKPEDLYGIGQKIKVIVLEKNEEEGKILLSIKRLQEDPWSKIKDEFVEGKEVKGEVTKIAPFGVFVRVGEGIDGLVHNSKLVDLNLDFKPKDKGMFRIASLNISLKRMSLEPIIDKN